MAKPKKPRRPSAATPRGFRDYFGPQVTARKAMLDRIAEVYHRYGFDALETSAVETVEALGKFLPDVDRPNEGVFAWSEDEDWLALRYDMTAPLARVYAQHRNELPTPYRRYAMGPVWRNEKPGPGRFRQFYQCDADSVGTASVAADAEICAMLADTLEAVGIERGDYVVRVNNRKVLNGVMEAAGIAEDDERVRGIVLRAIDKLDRLGPEGVRALLGEGRKDGSGDFTKGAGLSSVRSDAIMRFVNLREAVADRLASLVSDLFSEGMPSSNYMRALTSIGEPEEEVEPKAGEEPTFHSADAASSELRNRVTAEVVSELVGGSQVGREGVDELEQIAALLEAQGYGPDRIIIDPSVVRGLGYYTGPVYEAELTFEIPDEHGRPRQFGSVAGGGRYDDLVTRFTGQQVPATGVSIGVDRLLAALEAKGRLHTEAQGPIVVTVMDRDRMADYQAICATLRNAELRAEVYLGNPKNFGNQLKYADRRGAPAAVIQGSDEAAEGMVQVKDLILGKKLAEEASLEEWKDHPSQTKVRRDDLPREIARIFRLHGLALPAGFRDDAPPDGA